MPIKSIHNALRKGRVRFLRPRTQRRRNANIVTPIFARVGKAEKHRRMEAARQQRHTIGNRSRQSPEINPYTAFARRRVLIKHKSTRIARLQFLQQRPQ